MTYDFLRAMLGPVRKEAALKQGFEKRILPISNNSLVKEAPTDRNGIVTDRWGNLRIGWSKGVLFTNPGYGRKEIRRLARERQSGWSRA